VTVEPDERWPAGAKASQGADRCCIAVPREDQRKCVRRSGAADIRGHTALELESRPDLGGEARRGFRKGHLDVMPALAQSLDGAAVDQAPRTAAHPLVAMAGVERDSD
jgi:hypothetical protein